MDSQFIFPLTQESPAEVSSSDTGCSQLKDEWAGTYFSFSYLMSRGRERQLYKNLGGVLLNPSFTVDRDSVLLVFISQWLTQCLAHSRNKQMNMPVNRSGIHVSEHVCIIRTGSAAVMISLKIHGLRESRRDVVDGRLQLVHLASSTAPMLRMVLNSKMTLFWLWLGLALL